MLFPQPRLLWMMRYSLFFFCIVLCVPVRALAQPEPAEEEAGNPSQKDSKKSKEETQEEAILLMLQGKEDAVLLQLQGKEDAISFDEASIKLPGCAPRFGPGHPYYHPPPGKVTFDYQITSSGEGLERLILRVFYRQRRAVQQCYNASLKVDPLVMETLVFSVDINKKEVTIFPEVPMEGHLLELQECVIKTIPKFAFSAFEKANFIIRYTFQPLPR